MSYLLIASVLCSIVIAEAIRIEPGLGAYHSAGDYDGYSGYAAAPALRVQVLKSKPLRSHEKEQQQDFSKIPGVAGHDFPIYHSVPETSFSCDKVPHRPGMYANVEAHCQAYHVCHDGREGKQGSKFLCTNGTLFNQEKFTCDWWYNVNCAEALQHYNLNLDPLKNPYYQKPKEEKVQEQVQGHIHEYQQIQPVQYQPEYYHKK